MAGVLVKEITMFKNKRAGYFAAFVRRRAALMHRLYKKQPHIIKYGSGGPGEWRAGELGVQIKATRL